VEQSCLLSVLQGVGQQSFFQPSVVRESLSESVCPFFDYQHRRCQKPKGLWSFFVFPSRAKYVKFFDWMGGGYTDPRMDIWFEHMLDVVELGSVKVNGVPQQRELMTSEELQSVTMPVLIMGSGKPIVYKDPQAFADAARAALPHAEVEIVPDAGHGLNMEKPDYVNGRTLEFLAANYR